MDASQVSVRSALSNGGASYLNGARFSTPSLIVSMNEMGRGIVPEIKTLYISLSIAITIAAE
jgi:hypothetical protein